MPIDAFALGLQGQAAKRRAAADAALVAAYGDEAGNPEAYASLQKTSQARELQPYAVPTAQADIAGKQATTAHTQAQTGDLGRKGIAESTYQVALGAKAARDAGQDPVAAIEGLAQAAGLPPTLTPYLQGKVRQNPAEIDNFIAAFEKQSVASGALPAAAIQEYSFRNGLTPDQQKVFDENKRASFNTVRDIGGVPTAVRVGQGPTGGTPAQTPLSSLPQELDAAGQLANTKAVNTKAGEVRGTAQATLPDIRASYDALKGRTAEIRALPGLKSILGSPDFTKAIASGGFGALPFQFPGTDAADAAISLNGLVSQVQAEGYNILRGTGPVATAEGKLIGDSLAALGRPRSYEGFLREFDRLDKLLDRRMRAFEQKAGQAPVEATPVAKVRDLSGLGDDELFKMLDHPNGF